MQRTNHTATRCCSWVRQKLREFIIKGFVMDDDRLKKPDKPFAYFEELLRRIQAFGGRRGASTR